MDMTKEQEKVIGEVISYWQKQERWASFNISLYSSFLFLRDVNMAEFSEQDVLSLLSVISGHFILGQQPSLPSLPLNHNESQQCPLPYCGKWFDKMSQLEKHKTTMHPQSNTSSKSIGTNWPCGQCDQSFLYEPTLRNHLKSHFVRALGLWINTHRKR